MFSLANYRYLKFTLNKHFELVLDCAFNKHFHYSPFPSKYLFIIPSSSSVIRPIMIDYVEPILRDSIRGPLWWFGHVNGHHRYFYVEASSLPLSQMESRKEGAR